MAHLYDTALAGPGYLDYSSDDEDTLPYPAPLPRSDFLSEDFDPSAYLSTLRNRHQTLEDLRGELRARSQLLNQELLDLVNGNYEEFLGLGADLQGGDEKVEGVRLGLLGFQREVEGVRKAVGARKAAVEELLAEKRDVRAEVALGRALLDVEAQVAELEESLGGEVDDDDEEPLQRLQEHVQRYLLVQQVMARIGAHPFLQTLQPRVEEVRKTLLLDLSVALKEAKREKGDMLAVVRMYGDIGAQADGVKALKGV